jgi:hypothetical protein
MGKVEIENLSKIPGTLAFSVSHPWGTATQHDEIQLNDTQYTNMTLCLMTLDAEPCYAENR